MNIYYVCTNLYIKSRLIHSSLIRTNNVRGREIHQIVRKITFRSHRVGRWYATSTIVVLKKNILYGNFIWSNINNRNNILSKKSTREICDGVDPNCLCSRPSHQAMNSIVNNRGSKSQYQLFGNINNLENKICNEPCG